MAQDAQAGIARLKFRLARYNGPNTAARRRSQPAVQSFAREGVGRKASTPAFAGAGSRPDGSAPAPAALQRLGDALAGTVMTPQVPQVEDTPVPVLAPGTGRTRSGRPWTCVRDKLAFAGERPYGSNPWAEGPRRRCSFIGR